LSPTNKVDLIDIKELRGTRDNFVEPSRISTWSAQRDLSHPSELRRYRQH
jgi:hypothetical protein